MSVRVFEGFSTWNIKVEKGITDTSNYESWIPKSLIRLEFFNKTDSTCLSPRLEFYPIEYEKFIEEKLKYYLLFRANLFPPPPFIYKTDEHIVVAWEFEDYGNEKCCNCNLLEDKLIKKLNLTSKPKLLKLKFSS